MKHVPASRSREQTIYRHTKRDESFPIALAVAHSHPEEPFLPKAKIDPIRGNVRFAGLLTTRILER
jgi:hypothetical protein